MKASQSVSREQATELRRLVHEVRLSAHVASRSARAIRRKSVLLRERSRDLSVSARLLRSGH